MASTTLVLQHITGQFAQASRACLVAYSQCAALLRGGYYGSKGGMTRSYQKRWCAVHVQSSHAASPDLSRHQLSLKGWYQT